MVASSLPLAPPIALADVGPAAAITALHEFIERTGWSRPVFPVVRHGHVATGIVDYAAEVGADLLVVGTSRPHGGRPLVAGIHGGARGRRGAVPGAEHSTRGRRAGGRRKRSSDSHMSCVPWTLSAASMRALERGLSLAQEVRRSRHLAPRARRSRRKSSSSPRWAFPSTSTLREKGIRGARAPGGGDSERRARLVSRARGRATGDVRHRSSWRKRISHKADLIVMGSQGHHGLLARAPGVGDPDGRARRELSGPDPRERESVVDGRARPVRAV